jgi:tetratricopeptide (TPR) repeat protein
VEARKWIERAVAMAPNNAHYRNELAESYKTERKWDKAAALFEQAAGDARAFSPDDVKNSELARALRGSGFVRIETGQLVEAQKLFEECLRLDPGDANAQRELRYIADLRAKSAVN